MRILTATLIGILALPSTAEIIDLGNITRDTETQLDWLDLTETTGRNYAEIYEQLSPSGEYEGWRFATLDEIELLFNNLGYTTPYNEAAWEEEDQLAAMLQAFDLLGVINDDFFKVSYGYTANTNESDERFLIQMFYDSPVEARLTYSVDFNRAISDVGSFLVKSYEPDTPPSPFSCTHEVLNKWGTGFQAKVTITNDSDELIEGWVAIWEYPDGISVNNFWNADFSGSNPYSASNLNWNKTIYPGQNKSFGLIGKKSRDQEIGDILVNCE